MESKRGISKAKLLLLGFTPLFALAAVVGLFFIAGSTILAPVTTSVLPVEDINFERVILREGLVVVTVVNTGPTNVTIAQVLVNDAIWDAEIRPSQTLPRLGSVTITIPYHWVEGEPIEVTVITSNGFLFKGGVEAATFSPSFSLGQIAAFASIGVYVGIIPVFIGLAWLPFLSHLRDKWYNFLLSVTAGLLVFLAVDAFGEALELVRGTPSVFQGLALVIATVTVTFLALEAVGERSLRRWGQGHGSRAAPMVLAYLVALGIGIHNLGEGLLIGAAYSLGEVALGAFLILGFTIHNATEGFAIVAPIASGLPKSRRLLELGLLAGGPTIFGALIGGYAYSNLWALVFLAVGVGAILQVVYEVVEYMAEGRAAFGVLSEGTNLAGLAVGFAIAYGTALLVP